MGWISCTRHQLGTCQESFQLCGSRDWVRTPIGWGPVLNGEECNSSCYWYPPILFLSFVTFFVTAFVTALWLLFYGLPWPSIIFYSVTVLWLLSVTIVLQPSTVVYNLPPYSKSIFIFVPWPSIVFVIHPIYRTSPHLSLNIIPLLYIGCHLTFLETSPHFLNLLVPSLYLSSNDIAIYLYLWP